MTLIEQNRVPKVERLVDITDHVNQIARELRNALIWDDPAKVSLALESAQKSREQIERRCRC